MLSRDEYHAQYSAAHRDTIAHLGQTIRDMLCDTVNQSDSSHRLALGYYLYTIDYIVTASAEMQLVATATARTQDTDKAVHQYMTNILHAMRYYKPARGVHVPPCADTAAQLDRKVASTGAAYDSAVAVELCQRLKIIGALDLYTLVSSPDSSTLGYLISDEANRTGTDMTFTDQYFRDVNEATIWFHRDYVALFVYLYISLKRVRPTLQLAIGGAAFRPTLFTDAPILWVNSHSGYFSAGAYIDGYDVHVVGQTTDVIGGLARAVPALLALV